MRSPWCRRPRAPSESPPRRRQSCGAARARRRDGDGGVVAGRRETTRWQSAVARDDGTMVAASEAAEAASATRTHRHSSTSAQRRHVRPKGAVTRGTTDAMVTDGPWIHGRRASAQSRSPRARAVAATAPSKRAALSVWVQRSAGQSEQRAGSSIGSLKGRSAAQTCRAQRWRPGGVVEGCGARGGGGGKSGSGMVVMVAVVTEPAMW